jgi:hypothetical protein
MPILGVIASSKLSVSPVNRTNFIATITPNTSADTGAQAVNVLSNGTIAVGTWTSQSPYGSYVALLDPTAVTVSSGREINDAGGTSYIFIDSDDDLLIANGKQSEARYMRQNSSQTIQAQVSYNMDFIQGAYHNASANTMYFSGYPLSSPYDSPVLVTSEDGTIASQFALSSPSPVDMLPYGFTVSSTGNLYVVGFIKGATRGYMASINSSYNAFNWQKENNPNYIWTSVKLAPSNGLYAIGTGTGGTQNAIVTTSIDSSGNINWQRIFTNGAGAIGPGSQNAIDTDSDGNIYVAGNGYFGGYSTEGFLAKYNSSGTLQWQRKIGASASAVRFESLKVSGDDIYAVGGFNLNPSRGFIACVPTDGSLTGTYSLHGQTVTYAAASLTEAAGGFTFGNAGATIVSSSYSATTTTFTATSDTGSLTKATI